jgi:acyl dehydratase
VEEGKFIMSKLSFNVPIEDRYFEDYVVGLVHESGSITVEEEEIIDFAKRFDPQVFHTDPEGAKKTSFGGLVASGWHTSGLVMRLLVENYFSKVANLSSPGLDEVRWLKPVRPFDKLSVRATVQMAMQSRTKPDRGVLRSLIEVMNQRHETVMTMILISIMLCRES